MGPGVQDPERSKRGACDLLKSPALRSFSRSKAWRVLNRGSDWSLLASSTRISQHSSLTLSTCKGFVLCTFTWFASFQAREGGLSGPQDEKRGEQGSEGKWVWGQDSSAAWPGLALPGGRAKGFKVVEQSLHSTRALEGPFL